MFYLDEKHPVLRKFDLGTLINQDHAEFKKLSELNALTEALLESKSSKKQERPEELRIIGSGSNYEKWLTDNGDFGLLSYLATMRTLSIGLFLCFVVLAAGWG